MVKSSKQPRCTVQIVFKILMDGEWHEGKAIDGTTQGHGTKRVRELRTKEWGKWNVIAKRGKHVPGVPSEKSNDWFYRIDPKELEEKSLIAELVKRGEKPPSRPEEDDDEVDKKVDIELTVFDCVFLLAVLTNNAQLKDPVVKTLWDNYWPRLSTKFRDVLPKDITAPFDLFHHDDEEEED